MVENENSAFKDEVSELVAEVQLEWSGLLRCVITFNPQKAGEPWTHLFIFIVGDENKLYMIESFQDDLQKQLESDEQKFGKGKLDLEKKRDYDQQMTSWIHRRETMMGSQNSISALLVNANFKSSVVILAP